MADTIFWKNDNDGVSFVKVAGTVTLEKAVAAVPSDKAYGIMDSDDLPDRTFRDAWTCDDADLIYNVSEVVEDA